MSEPRHNPWDGLCSKWNLGEPTREDARCPICRPAVRQPTTEPASERVTHGRHCICSACARQDWSEPYLAACGMHGKSCAAMYQPLGNAGDVVNVVRTPLTYVAALAAARGDTP